MIKLSTLLLELSEEWNSDIWKSNIEPSNLWKSDIWNSHIWENENSTDGKIFVPPEPGTVPIPSNHIRLYHYTNADPDVIRREGLLLSKARGHSYGEPDFIWGSTQIPSHYKNYIEFSVPMDDKRFESIFGSGPDKRQSPKYYEKGVHHFTLIGDVKPQEFIAVHEPWHYHYRYMIDGYVDDVLKGEYDWVLNHKTGMEAEKKAILAIKRNFGNNQQSINEVESSTDNHEKLAKLFIYNVWRYMPKSDRFSPYQFSLWMDNETNLQEMKQKICDQLYPNDDDASGTFFDKDIIPTLEKMEQKILDRKAKKIDSNDPLFILKSIVKNKTYEGAKQSLYKSQLGGWSYKGGRIKDEDANEAFERLYRHAMGETMYSDEHFKRARYLSDLRNPSPTKDHVEELFIQQLAGWNLSKFPEFVKVWRGTNSPLNKIKPGDYVTFDKDYADSYARGKFKAVIQSILPSKDLKVDKMDVDNSELVYWPHGHQIKKYEGHIPTFREFWEIYR